MDDKSIISKIYILIKYDILYIEFKILNTNEYYNINFFLKL